MKDAPVWTISPGPGTTFIVTGPGGIRVEGFDSNIGAGIFISRTVIGLALEGKKAKDELLAAVLEELKAGAVKAS